MAKNTLNRANTTGRRHLAVLLFLAMSVKVSRHGSMQNMYLGKALTPVIIGIRMLMAK